MALESGQSVSFDLKDIFILDLYQWLMSTVSLGMVGVGVKLECQEALEYW